MPVPVACWQAQYLSPGNRIDLVVATDDPKFEKMKAKHGITLQQDLMVMEVHRATREGNPCAIVVAITPNEAQQVALAHEDGSIHVPVRSAGDSETHPMESASFFKLFRN